MKFNRRIFLALLGFTGASIGAITGSKLIKNDSQDSLAKEAKDSQKTTDLDTFSALTDALIPADDSLGKISAGALDLNIDQTLKEKAQQDTTWQSRIELLEKNANAFAAQYFKQPFVELNQDNKETVLHLLFSFKDVSDHQQLLEHLSFKQEVMSLYYNSPQGHKSLGYVPPYKYPTYQ